MTLEQAYKMRREENLSLLRENERLKKQLDGVFPVTEKETLERKIRHLEQIIKTAEKRYDSMREHCRITESRCFDLDLEILDLKEQIASLSSENEALRIRAEKAEAEVLMLNGTKKLLEKKLNPPSKVYMDGYNLHLKLSRYQKEHLLFLTHPEIDCTNNISERELRKFKRKQKQAVILRSDLGGRRICDALTIIETAKIQGQSVYDAVASAFMKCYASI